MSPRASNKRSGGLEAQSHAGAESGRWRCAAERTCESTVARKPISQHEPMEIAVEPGRHRFKSRGRGSEPIVTSATVAADGRELVPIARRPPTAKLVFDWPADDRKDAELIIDGSRQTVPTVRTARRSR